MRSKIATDGAIAYACIVMAGTPIKPCSKWREFELLCHVWRHMHRRRPGEREDP
jgi:hypothetical protein